jgi:hypothetical protein
MNSADSFFLNFGDHFPDDDLLWKGETEAFNLEAQLTNYEPPGKELGSIEFCITKLFLFV